MILSRNVVEYNKDNEDFCYNFIVNLMLYNSQFFSNQRQRFSIRLIKAS